MTKRINASRMSASQTERKQLDILQLLIQHTFQRFGTLQRGERQYLGHTLAYPYQCGGRFSRDTHSSGPLSRDQEWFRLRGCNSQLTTNMPNHIDRFQMPSIWFHRMSPFDNGLRWRTHIISWQGSDVGPEDMHGGWTGYRFCRTANGGIAALHFPSDWTDIVPGGAQASDFYGEDHALAGWSKYGPLCCLQPWRCEECTSPEWNAASVFECRRCKRRRPYPELHPSELWSMDRAQRLCTSLRHNHGGDNDNQQAVERRQENRKLGRTVGVLYDLN